MKGRKILNAMLPLNRSMPPRICKGADWFVYMMVQRTIHSDKTLSFRTDIYKSQHPWLHLLFSKLWGSPSKYPSMRSSTPMSQVFTEKGSRKRTNLSKSSTNSKLPSGTRKKSRKRSGCSSEHFIAMIIGPFETEYLAWICSHIWRTKTRAAIPRCSWGVALSRHLGVRYFIDWNVLIDTCTFTHHKIDQYQNAVVLTSI